MNTVLETTKAESTKVLLKDKIESGLTVAGPVKALVSMESSRIDWEQGIYCSSNKMKYEILTDCYGFCGELSISDAKLRGAALEAFFKERGYKYKKDLPLATRVVRAVFGDIDRRRISTYSIVLRQAQKEQVPVSDLASWIEQRGGVQEISLTRSPTFISPKQKADIAKSTLQGKSPIGFAKSELLSHLADPDFIGEPCVLLAEQQADGTFGVFTVLRQPSLVNSAFAVLYAVQQEVSSKAQAEVDAANDADGAVAKSA
jgi:hypothetical protein